uniref:Uncharacterized protein n=1 Tax=Nelumbo nucifera TaxID=4432 RepID=A0A822YRX8_NELNU|nr:TPA_asm: hypothetical protein HUJ06_005910 [Nelumbo nucifera]
MVIPGPYEQSLPAVPEWLNKGDNALQMTAVTLLLVEPVLCRLVLPVSNSRGAFYGGGGGVQLVNIFSVICFVSSGPNPEQSSGGYPFTTTFSPFSSNLLSSSSSSSPFSFLCFISAAAPVDSNSTTSSSSSRFLLFFVFPPPSPLFRAASCSSGISFDFLHLLLTKFLLFGSCSGRHRT